MVRNVHPSLLLLLFLKSSSCSSSSSPPQTLTKVLAHCEDTSHAHCIVAYRYTQWGDQAIPLTAISLCDASTSSTSPPHSPRPPLLHGTGCTQPHTHTYTHTHSYTPQSGCMMHRSPPPPAPFLEADPPAGLCACACVLACVFVCACVSACVCVCQGGSVE